MASSTVNPSSSANLTPASVQPPGKTVKRPRPALPLKKELAAPAARQQAPPREKPAPQPPRAQRPERQADEERSQRRVLAAWMPQMRAWLVSSLFHMALILLLALLTLSVATENELALVVSPADDVLLDDDPEVFEFQVEVDVENLAEAMADSESVVSELEALAAVGSLGDEVQLDSVVGEHIEIEGIGMADLLSEIGGGSELAGLGNVSRFFGSESAGNRIVFVVDNSNSMRNGRMETALIELQKSISALNSKQFFHVVFYSDAAYPMFFPDSSVNRLIPATEENKAMVASWLQTVEMCLYTRGRDAIEIARSLYPDVVYILGDGAFGDNLPNYLRQRPLTGAVVHTLGMQVSEEDSEDFRSIAETHGGTYRDVGITDEGRAMLRRNGPINRNTTRGPVWGVALPENR